MNAKTYNLLTEIPDLSYEGYVWLSDAANPIVLNNEKYAFDKVEINPFIIEALLYNAERNTSIHIQHTGDYQIAEYNLTAIKNTAAVLEDKEYLPHRLDGVKNLKFKQVWTEEVDKLCEDMTVLKLRAIVFCGFNKK